MGNKKKKHVGYVKLAENKLNSIESKIYKALIMKLVMKTLRQLLTKKRNIEK